MAKTTVANIVAEIKGDVDYNVTDSDLDTLIIRGLNKAIKRVKNLLKDYGFNQDITASSSFKTIDSQAYVDITKAAITGDATTFTGATGDKVNITIDGTAHTNIDVSACTTIATVVTAINTAVGSTVAAANGGGYLVITSPTTGSSSSVTIADDGAASGAVDSLFSVAAERTHTAISDLDEVIALTERTNDTRIEIISYADLIAIQPDPTSSESSTPDFAARHNNYIYFRSTPASAIYIYIDYYKLITDVATGGTMPFEDKFDPLIVAMTHLNLARFLDSRDAVAIGDLKNEIKELKDELIINAAHDIGVSKQCERRTPDIPYFSPKKVI